MNDSSGTIALAALGILGTSVAAMAWVVKYSLTKSGKDLAEHTAAAKDQAKSNEYVAKALLRGADSDEKMTEALHKMASSNQEIAKEAKLTTAELKRGNDQSEARNGHLGELIVQQGELTKGLAEGAVSKITEVIQHVDKQHIGQQTIDSSTVKNEIVEKEIVEYKEKQ